MSNSVLLISIILLAYCGYFMYMVPPPSGLSPSLGRYTPKEKAPGSFITLSFGETHYRVRGPKDGPKVVFVHGISTSSAVFDGVATYLANNGYRVLQFDTWGRGFTDSPNVHHAPEIYVSQIFELTTKLGFDKFDMIGYSMGGAVTSLFFHRHSSMVNKMVLIAPGGIPHHLPFSSRLGRIPGVMDLLAPYVVAPTMMKLAHREFVGDDKEMIETKIQAFKDQNENNPGWAIAVGRSTTEFPIRDTLDSYAEMGKASNPVLLMWGDQDGTCPFHHHEILQKLIPQAQLFVAKGLKHYAPLEAPELYHEALGKFLKE